MRELKKKILEKSNAHDKKTILLSGLHSSR
jgi:hypothetical protein